VRINFRECFFYIIVAGEKQNEWHNGHDECEADESVRGLPPKTDSNGAPVGAYRVLVVTNDERLLALTRLSLAKNGLVVEAASTAYEGLATASASAHDLVILDTPLPDLSGWEVLRRVRGSSDLPVMLLTSRDSDVDKARGLDLGADDYLTKPFSFLEFEARVRALLRRARTAKPDRGAPVTGTMPEANGVTVAIVAERRHLGNEALTTARSTLEASGCSVPLVVPDVDRVFDIPSEAPPWDAVMSRGRDLAGLGMLAAASALGVVAINSPQSIELVRNPDLWFEDVDDLGDVSGVRPSWFVDREDNLTLLDKELVEALRDETSRAVLR
jgi:DNA-binding response OmpR family regulator